MSDETIKQLSNVTLISIGFKSKGTSEKGKEWSLYNYAFDIEGKTRNMGVFLPIPFKDSLTHEALMPHMGEQFDIKFKEEPYVLPSGEDAGKEVQVKRLLGVYQANTLTVPPVVVQPDQLGQTTEGVPTGASHVLPQTAIVPPVAVQQPVNQAEAPKWNDVAFSCAYRDSPDVNISEKTLENFIGSYIGMNPTWIVLKGKLQTLFDTYVHPK